MKWIPWVAIVILLGVAGYFQQTGAAARRQSSIDSANVRAARDTLQEVRDSTGATITKLVHQGGIDTDSILNLGTSLSKALAGREVDAQALVAINVELESVKKANVKLTSDLITANRGGGLERVVVVKVDTALSKTIQGEVALSVPADTAEPVVVEFVDLAVLPFTMTPVLGCDDENNAVVAVETPPYIHTNLAQATVDPEFCHGLAPKGFNLVMPTFGKAIYAGGAALITALVLLIGR